ncbi:hypothetical protein [Hanstruepera ponticola]|uniref:hypothetical protein n=1 Tax=Hanstruepera ponticola TaxID=2042995 RepID=UPI001781D530|nr:hypothetical protein [Hanstruepera ponticola]
MNYNDAFAIDNVSYLERKKDKGFTPEKYKLQNHDYHKPKLVKDFYLKYFTKELLFEIDILEVKEFLQYHYDYCDNPDLYFKVLDLKIVTKIDELTEFAQASFEGGEMYNEIKLEDGFVENEGFIDHKMYCYSLMSHITAFSNLQSDLTKRKKIIESFIELFRVKENAPPKPLKWVAGPASLAIIIRELIDKGYMEADRHRGEINCSKLSRDLLKAFDLKADNPEKTLEIYLSNGNKRHADAKAKFDRMDFFIPDVNFTL